MSDRFDALHDRAAIADTEQLLAELEALTGDDRTLRQGAMAACKRSLAEGRAELDRRLLDAPAQGLIAANGYAYMNDTVLTALFAFVTRRLHPLANPTAGERLMLLGVGGFGRGEMAPHSDVDIAFVTPWRQPPWAEAVIESLLYLLWDLGLKVGHSSRSLDDMIRLAKGDVTIRTALLESRLVAGDAALYAEARRRFHAEVQHGTESTFVAEKFAERDARHLRMGDSRYVVEPNVKEGKGGLRDLHALFWIGKYVHDVRRAAELVDVGLFTRAEYRLFHRADNFLWAVRCHLHVIAGRAEDRLTFDTQREIAGRMRFADRPGRSAVERFMQYYFLQARSVGTLTGVFLAHLDEAFAARGRRFGLPTIRRRPRRLHGFVLDRGRLALPRDDFLSERPQRLIELFHLADAHQLQVHPLAMRAAARDAKRVDEIREDRHANAMFLDILTSPRDPELVLRWMNEAGVLGRFVPDFGRIVAQMQFDMYHHYTVDEHTIRAIGLLARIERGELGDDHPLATAVARQIVSERVLRTAVLLHDIAKGRGGDHSVLGAEVAQCLCPRLGLSAAETEAVAWLVRWHLLMSATAFKRDLTDPKTILDFAGAVQSPERLRLLMLLTVVDIRAVGPGVWNGWKRQLLRSLYEAAEEVLRLGHKQHGRSARIVAKQTALHRALGWPEDIFSTFVRRFPDAYWVAEPEDVLEHNARFVAAAADSDLAIDLRVYPEREATLVSIHALDHPGLFYRIAGAIHGVGGNIIDARIHTTRDGMVIDNFLIQDPHERPIEDATRLARLKAAIADALGSDLHDPGAGIVRTRRSRPDAFPIAPAVLMDNAASNRFTVIEVNARDRPALLSDLARAFFDAGVTIHSAHVATYGERAVDTFYLTDLSGARVTAPQRLKSLEKRLLAATHGAPARAA